MDRQRFEQLWLRCAMDGARPEAGQRFEVIRSHYLEPHRRYHTPEHVVHCLGQFDDARAHMDHPDAVELAVWYHDVIYDVRGKDNELHSAQLFQEHARQRLPDDLVQEVHDLIMVTTHNHVEPGSSDEAFMVDIDLSSFGLPWDRFLRDSVAVRDEAPHLSDEEFYTRQKAFLASLLRRGHFCHTEFFRVRHEDRARENITRYLEELEQKGLV